MGVVINEFPDCGKGDCEGTMLPIEDVYGNQPYIKGWVCSNPDCGHNIMNQSGMLVTKIIKSEKVQ